MEVVPSEKLIEELTAFVAAGIVAGEPCVLAVDDTLALRLRNALHARRDGWQVPPQFIRFEGDADAARIEAVFRPAVEDAIHRSRTGRARLYAQLPAAQALWQVLGARYPLTLFGRPA